MHISSYELQGKDGLNNLNIHVFPPVVYTWERETQGKSSDFPVFTWEDSWKTKLKSRVQFISSHPGQHCPQWRLPVHITGVQKGAQD